MHKHTHQMHKHIQTQRFCCFKLVRKQTPCTPHYRKDCRDRELAAGRPCPRNKHSAASKSYNDKRHPKNNLKYNPKNNQKRKLALRDANLQAVIDDPAISTIQKMSDGTIAAVSVLTDVDWADLHA